MRGAPGRSAEDVVAAVELIRRDGRAPAVGLGADTSGIDGWTETLRALAREETSLRWAIGDWMLYGASAFGPKAFMAAAASGLAEKMIASTFVVCRVFAPERRRPELTFSHHDEVKSQPPDIQDRLLQQAIDEGLSKTVVRSLVQQMSEDRRSLTAGGKNPDRH